MKLIIVDQGDSSVGIFQTIYEIDCPFERIDADEEMLRDFSNDIQKIYKEYSQGKLDAMYDFEKDPDYEG